MISRETHIALLRLHRNGVSIRAIAQLLGISTHTVQKYLRIPPTEKTGRAKRPSRLDAYKDAIETIINDRSSGEKQAYTLKAAHERLLTENPSLDVSYRAFCQFVKDKCTRSNEPKLARIPLEHAPGEAQIDFCAVNYYQHGKQHQGKQFTMYFPFSGVALALLYPSENQQCLLHGLLTCFKFIRFVPRRVLFDNASIAVERVSKTGRKVADMYEAFSAWYGFQIEFCNPASGWEKGGVEVMNKVLRRRHFVPAPEIEDLQAFSAELIETCFNESMSALHYLKKVKKSELWKDEQRAGHPVKAVDFDIRKAITRQADKCALITIDGVKYGTTDKHACAPIIARVGPFSVDIYDVYNNLLCTHPRSYRPGAVIIQTELYKDAQKARPRAHIHEKEDD